MKHAPDFFRSGSGHAGDVSALPFAFGVSSHSATAALPAIDRINERLVRRCRSIIEPLARCRVNVTAAPIAVMRYADWQDTQPEITLASLYGFAPMKGAILLAFAPEMLRTLLDRYFGGTANQSSNASPELTPSEEKFLARLTGGLVEALTGSWTKSLPVEATLRSRETNLAYAVLVPGDELVAVSPFVIELSTRTRLAFSILYPLAGLRSIDQHLADPVDDDSDAGCTIWRARLGNALANVRFDARTVLARPQISLEKLMALSVGDVLPVAMTAEVPMIVADRTIAMGTMGDADGTAALQIVRILNRKTGQ